MRRQRQPFKSGPRDERAHPLIENYLNVHGLDSGIYAPLALSGAARPEWGLYSDPAAAAEDRRCMYRGARHYGLSVHVLVKNGPASGTGITGFLTFALYRKDTGRQHVLQKSGGRPENLAYNPYAPKGPRRRWSG